MALYDLSIVKKISIDLAGQVFFAACVIGELVYRLPGTRKIVRSYGKIQRERNIREKFQSVYFPHGKKGPGGCQMGNKGFTLFFNWQSLRG